MRCLTPAEVSAWLNPAQLPAGAPDDEIPGPQHHLQCGIPPEYPQVSSFARALLARITGSGPVLILIADWSNHEADQMLAIDSIRQRAGELRPLIEAPGHLMEPAETDTAAALFSLATVYQWTFWLYSKEENLVLLNRRGKHLDLWIEDSAMLKLMEKLAENRGFTVTPLPPS